MMPRSRKSAEPSSPSGRKRAPANQPPEANLPASISDDSNARAAHSPEWQAFYQAVRKALQQEH